MKHRPGQIEDRPQAWLRFRFEPAQRIGGDRVCARRRGARGARFFKRSAHRGDGGGAAETRDGETGGRRAQHRVDRRQVPQTDGLRGRHV